VPSYAVVSRGAGKVVLAPFRTEDLGAANEQDRFLHEQIWGRILETCPRRYARGWSSTPSAVPAVARFQRPAGPHALFVILAGLCLGPGCMLLVRKRHHRIHIIWLIPVLAAVLTCVAFLWGGTVRGLKPRLETITLLSGDANSPRGSSEHYVGMLAGRAGDSVLDAIPAHSTITEDFENSRREPSAVGLFPATIHSDDPISMTDLHTNRWGMRFFRIQHACNMPVISGELAYRNGELAGWIRNDSNRRIEDAFICFKWNKCSLGNLEAGQRLEVALPLKVPPETAMVLNPWSGRFSRVSGPLNLRHWPDSPFNSGQLELLGGSMGSTGLPCHPPSLIALLPQSDSSESVPLLVDQAHTRNDCTIAAWRIPIQSVQVEGNGLPAALSIATHFDSGVWQYHCNVYRWGSAVAFEWPSAAQGIDDPELTLFTRLTESSKKKMTKDDKILVSLYNWSAGAWDDDMDLEIGAMEIMNAARYVRLGDTQVHARFTLDGKLAEESESVYLDRIEIAVKESGHD